MPRPVRPLDQEIASLERALSAAPDDPRLRERLRVRLLRAGAPDAAYALTLAAGEEDVDLARRVAEDQRPVLRDLLALVPDHVLVATGPATEAVRRVASCPWCPCCCDDCVPGREDAEWRVWRRLDDVLLEPLVAPVTVLRFHHPDVPDASALELAGHLTTLRGLTMSGLGLDDATMGALAGLRQLRALAVHGSSRALAPSALGGIDSLAHLEGLWLSRLDALAEDALRGIGRLSRLRSLSLTSDRWLRDAGLEHLTHMPWLEELDLGGCHWIDGRGLEPLCESAPALRRVTLFGCNRLSDGALLGLGDAPSFRELDLSFCLRLTDEALALLADAPRLARLDLYACNFSDAGLAALSELPALQSLDVRHCAGVTERGLAPFRERGVIVEWRS